MPEQTDRRSGAEQTAEPESHTVVGIGASAGGLAALRTFFRHTPADTGLAFVVVVHRSLEHESRLADLLQPHAPIPIGQVTETMPLEPNRAYVIPPGRNLSAIDTHLRLGNLDERGADRAPIDRLFRTLAETHDGHSVGIVLSGTGSDGTQGLRSIRERGGLTIVQDPDEAEHDGMPRNALVMGTADLVLPVGDMARYIMDFASASEPGPPVFTRGGPPRHAKESRASPAAEPAPSYGAVHEKLVERYAPPSLIVNEARDIVHLSGNAGRYLPNGGGTTGSNVFEVVREELRIELRAALQAARGRGRVQRSKPIPLQIEGATRHVTLHVGPPGEGDIEGLVLIVFDEIGEVDDESLEERVQLRTAEVREVMSRLTLAEHRERGRISRILHDDLQQVLYGIRMRLSMVRDHARAGNVPALLDQAEQADAWLADAIAKMRQLSVDLSPPILEGEGLADAIGWLRTQMKELHGLDIEVEETAEVEPLSQGMRVLLFQVVRELLFNVRKHADVDRARVEVRQRGDLVEVDVLDEGRGFDPEHTQRSGAGAPGLLGFSSARERLALFGGGMEIDSRPGLGTRVRVRVPVRGSPPMS